MNILLTENSEELLTEDGEDILLEQDETDEHVMTISNNLTGDGYLSYPNK